MYDFCFQGSLQRTLISAAPPWLPSRCSTSHSRRQMRSRARGGTATSSGKRRYCRQLTILRHVCIGSSANPWTPYC